MNSQWHMIHDVIPALACCGNLTQNPGPPCVRKNCNTRETNLFNFSATDDVDLLYWRDTKKNLCGQCYRAFARHLRGTFVETRHSYASLRKLRSQTRSAAKPWSYAVCTQHWCGVVTSFSKFNPEDRHFPSSLSEPRAYGIQFFWTCFSSTQGRLKNGVPRMKITSFET